MPLGKATGCQRKDIKGVLTCLFDLTEQTLMWCPDKDNPAEMGILGRASFSRPAQSQKERTVHFRVTGLGGGREKAKKGLYSINVIYCMIIYSCSLAIRDYLKMLSHAVKQRNYQSIFM